MREDRLRSAKGCLAVALFHILAVVLLRAVLDLEFTIPNPQKTGGSLGNPLNDLDFYKQLLPLDLLKNRLAESLWHLHAQPPLGNLLMGLMLKIFGRHAFSALEVFFLLMGAGNAFLFSLFLVQWTSSLRLALGAGLLWSLSPSLIAFEHVPFYTLLCANLALLAAWSLRAYSEERGSLHAFLLSLSLLGLVLLRSAFHLLFGLLPAVFLLARPFRGARKQVALFLLLPLLLVGGGWYAKNQIQFGFFGSCSWSWIHFYKLFQKTQRRETLELYAAGKIPECVFRIPPFSSLHRFKSCGFNRTTSIPATNRIWKREGYPNLNNINMIDLMPLYREADLALLKNSPLGILRSAWKGFLLFGRPSTEYPLLKVQVQSLKPLLFYNTILHAGAREEKGNGERLNLFHILFALAVVSRLPLALKRLRKGARSGIGLSSAVGELGVLYLLAYTAGITSFFDYGENMRFKFIVEPLFLGYFVALLHSFFLRRRGRAAEEG